MWVLKIKKVDVGSERWTLEAKKVDIGSEKVDIGSKKGGHWKRKKWTLKRRN